MKGEGRRPRRSRRIAAIVRTLMSRPGELLPLSLFTGELDAAKSTISEDLALVREALAEADMGQVETVAGPAGGVRYRPIHSPAWVARRLEELAGLLADPNRILTGGFLYITDLVFDPRRAQQLGEVFASVFAHVECDAVVTVETKGIPLALMTARALGKPLVSCRRDSRATEGTSISINYVSGSRRQIQTMSLPKRALAPNSRVLLVDDFLRGGGTLKGVQELMGEFGAQVVGTGVLIAMGEPRDKLVDDYLALVLLDEVDEQQRRVTVRPNEAVTAHMVSGRAGAWTREPGAGEGSRDGQRQ